MNKLIAIVEILKLTEDEQHIMFDLARESKNTIASDLLEHIMLSKKLE